MIHRMFLSFLGGGVSGGGSLVLRGPFETRLQSKPRLLLSGAREGLFVGFGVGGSRCLLPRPRKGEEKRRAEEGGGRIPGSRSSPRVPPLSHQVLVQIVNPFRPVGSHSQTLPDPERASTRHTLGSETDSPKEGPVLGEAKTLRRTPPSTLTSPPLFPTVAKL